MVHFSDKASRMKKIYIYVCMYVLYVCMGVCMHVYMYVCIGALNTVNS